MRKHYIKLHEDKTRSLNFFRQKYILILLPIATATFFLLFVNTKYIIDFQIREITLKNSSKYEFNDVIEKDFFVKTEACQIPGFDAFDKNIIEFYHTEDPIECHDETNPPLVESDQNSIWILENHLENYNVSKIKLFYCCYSPFIRPMAPEKGTSDSRFEYIKKCIIFSNRTIIKHEFIKVMCYYQDKEIYKDFHCFVIDKNKTKSTPHHPIKSIPQLSVLVIGIDAVSRLNFHRTMPKTLAILKNLSVIELKGYNKVGDNTYPNLMPVLTGLSEEEIEATCYTQKNSTFDDCHFIWDDYSDAGYRTAYAEDAAPIGLFNYMKRGFAGTPTDYYWRTFNRLAIKEIGHNKYMNSYLCLGPRLSVDVLLTYIKKFTRAITSPYFGFFWETSLTHDYLNFPLLGDQQFADLVASMHQEGFLNKTVLVLMSDHGIRWGGIRSTHQGQMEERLPFIYIVLPKIFEENFSFATYNLKKNTRRLTTPFDLHETFLDLLNLDQLVNERIFKKIQEKKYWQARGMSLFLPVNENRTCQSAAIDPHWCTCHQTHKLDVNDTIAMQLATLVVVHINKLLIDYVQCAKLNLSEILDVSVGESVYTKKLKNVDHIVTDYTVIVQTQPGLGLFEATVRNSSRGLTITGTVSRINLYGKQSACIHEYHLKLYCYCDNFYKF